MKCKYDKRVVARWVASMTVLVVSLSGLSAQTDKKSGGGGAAQALGRSNMSEPVGFYCNAKALTPGDRKNYNQLTDKLGEARLETKELVDGYAFRLKSEAILLSDIAAWISYERKCCPFFTFEIEVERDNGPVWLKLRGKEGVKPFIRAEFGVQ